jgi:cytosine/adenosine deaminase-related metal-dependent hydrolase
MHVEGTMTDSDAIVRPAFVDAHTHIGDSVAKEAGAGLSLDDLVAPPDGPMHRLRRARPRSDRPRPRRPSRAERLHRIERDGVPVVVCPRSTLVTGVGSVARRRAETGRRTA